MIGDTPSRVDCARPACPWKIRAALLGHADRSIAGHYASADVGRLIHEANLVLRREPAVMVVRQRRVE